MLVGVNGADADFDAPGKTGGAKTVALTNAQMRHKHRTSEGSDATASYTALSPDGGGVFGSNVEGGLNARSSTHGSVVNTVRLNYTETNSTLDTTAPDAHQNMSPYITVYMFVRLS